MFSEISEKVDILNFSLLELNGQNNLPKINLSFKKDLSREELVIEIGKIHDPNVFLWYFGEYGLREEGVSFYKTKILQKILKLKNNTNCLLYDLTAWGALRNPDIGLDAFNKNVDVINGFAQKNIQCLKSSLFFDWLGNEKSAEIDSYLKNVILERKVIFNASKEYGDNHVKIGAVFKENCPVLENEYNLDTSKSYSALQYVEGCYFINQVVESATDKGQKVVNLIFALPNDECKYYDLKDDCFLKDITVMLNEKLGEKLRDMNINIMFYAFEFGKNKQNRPYNAGKKNIDVITKSQLL